MKTQRLLPVLALLLSAGPVLIGACREACVNPPIVVGFLGFDSTETAVVIFRQFEKGTSYATLRTELRIPKDSFFRWNYSDPISDRYDYEFQFQGLSQTYRLYDVHFDGETQSRGPFGTTTSCSNTAAWTVNGIAKSMRGNPTAHDRPSTIVISIAK